MPISSDIDHSYQMARQLHSTSPEAPRLPRVLRVLISTPSHLPRLALACASLTRNSTMAMPRTPLAWPPVQHPHLGCFKALTVMKDHLLSWPITILLIWTVFSIFLVLRARRRIQNSRSLLTPDHIATGPPHRQKTSWSVKIRSNVSDGQSESSGQRSFSEGDSKLRSKLTMGLFLLFPCALLVLFHFQLVIAIHDHYRTLEHPLLQTKVASGLQEVFQVYQPVSFAPKGANACDLEVLLMDHVFGSSYGKPFVGKCTLSDPIDHPQSCV